MAGDQIFRAKRRWTASSKPLCERRYWKQDITWIRRDFVLLRRLLAALHATDGHTTREAVVVIMVTPVMRGIAVSQAYISKLSNPLQTRFAAVRPRGVPVPVADTNLIQSIPRARLRCSGSGCNADRFSGRYMSLPRPPHRTFACESLRWNARQLDNQRPC